LASSEDAHEHMRQIWVECDETWFKEMLNSEFLQLDFRSGLELLNNFFFNFKKFYEYTF